MPRSISSSPLTRHKICRIRTERTVPYPALVSDQRLFQLEVKPGADRPYLHRRICRARRQVSVPHVRRATIPLGSVPRVRTQQTARQVLVVRQESRHGLESRKVGSFFVQFPDVALPLLIVSQSFATRSIEPTLLFPATRQPPSDASVMDLMGTSPAGVYDSQRRTPDQLDTHQFMRAYIVRQIPLLDAPRLVARDDLALVRMNEHVVHCQTSEHQRDDK